MATMHGIKKATVRNVSLNGGCITVGDEVSNPGATALVFA